jgi:cytochrome c oxidase subunit 2
MKKRIVPFLLLAAALSAGAVFFFLRVYNIPGAASVQRSYMDPAIKTALTIGALVFIWVVTALAFVVTFHRRKPGDVSDGPPVKGNQRLEVAWTVLPLLVVIGVSIYGGTVLQDMTHVPANGALNVDVTAFRWGWKFTYPDYNITSFYLELEVNRPVELHMVSLDVVHSFWVQQFGPKQDIVPGMTTLLELTPDKIGQYTVICDQLCGMGHTDMTAPVYVVSTGDFQTWATQPRAPVTTATPTTTASYTSGQLALFGQGFFSISCARCHGSSGQGGSAPALTGQGNGLSKYGTAQGLLSFMSTAMPLDAPGSLAHEQYIDLLSFILVQDGFMQSGTPFVESNMASIALK